MPATTRRPSQLKSEQEAVIETAKDVAIDFLLRRAFPHGQWAHAREFIENQQMAPEVRQVLNEALDRNGT